MQATRSQDNEEEAQAIDKAQGQVTAIRTLSSMAVARTTSSSANSLVASLATQFLYNRNVRGAPGSHLFRRRHVGVLSVCSAHANITFNVIAGTANCKTLPSPFPRLWGSRCFYLS